MVYPVHSLVPVSPIFFYGSESDPPSPLHESSAERVTKEILRHVKIYPIRYCAYQLTRIQTQVCQILLCRIHLTHQTMSIVNKGDVQKRTKINSGVKRISMSKSNSAQSLQLSYLQPHKKSKVIQFKLDDYPLQRRSYLLSFVNSLKIVLSDVL